MPAYNAEHTLAGTLARLPQQGVDIKILVDDGSRDNTVSKAISLGLSPIVHSKNRGYGGNQKSCYQAALDQGAGVVVMLHPDLQYPPELVVALAAPILAGTFDVMLGSRMTGRGPVGMPGWRKAGNKLLTAFQNRCTGMALTEYHTGFRAYSREVLEKIDFPSFSDDFLFDNQFLIAAIQHGFRIGEQSIPTHYGPESSSISFPRAVRYGLGVVRESLRAAKRRAG